MKTLGRYIWFLVRSALIVLLVLGLCYAAFSVASDMSNSFIVVKEGMEKRIAVSLSQANYSELTKYFTPTFLADDAVLADDTYTDYVISSYSCKIQVKSLWVWSWRNEGEAVVVESVPVIRGSLPDYLMTAEQAAAGETVAPPEWEEKQYTLKLTREAGYWRISDILEVTDAPETAPTPTFSPTAAPTQTPAGTEGT